MTNPAFAELLEQLAGLKREAETIADDLARAAAEASRCEQRAMDAVRRGDDRAAREALEQHAVHADRVSIAEHELALIRFTEASCREILAAAGADAGDSATGAPSNGEL